MKQKELIEQQMNRFLDSIEKMSLSELNKEHVKISTNILDRYPNTYISVIKKDKKCQAIKKLIQQGRLERS